MKPTAPRSLPGRFLVGARLTLGVSALVAPRAAGRPFGLDADANPQLPFIGRMWGIRNVALAAGMVGLSGTEREAWWRLNVVVDVVDALAAVAAARRGELSKPAFTAIATTAVVAAASGALGARAEAQALDRASDEVPPA